VKYGEVSKERPVKVNVVVCFVESQIPHYLFVLLSHISDFVLHVDIMDMYVWIMFEHVNE